MSRPADEQMVVSGPFGKFDRRAAATGLKVYRDGLPVCHGLKLVRVPHAGGSGRPRFHHRASDGHRGRIPGTGRAYDQGEVSPGPPGWPITSRAIPHEQAARSRYNAVPPDCPSSRRRVAMSAASALVGRHVHAISEQGVDYLTALLQGYQDSPPAGVTPRPEISTTSIFRTASRMPRR